MRIAVCDDDPYYIELILRYSRECLESIGAGFEGHGYLSAAQLLNDAENLPYIDLFLIDIEMPEMSGFDMVPELYRAAPDARVAFVTAFAAYARDGYKYGAVRYILKDDDVLKTELSECLSEMIRTRRYSDVTETVKVGRRHLFIRICDIVYYESRRNYVYIITRSGREFRKEPAAVRLSRIAEYLEDKDFVRIHQSFLVNMRFIRRSNCDYVFFSNGRKLPVSRTYLKDASSRITDYRGRNLWTSYTR